jgi:acetyl-CoA carboxylase biotin carboxyl carrier protein
MGQNHESDVAFIRALAELLRSSDLSEIEVKRAYGNSDTLTVRVARTPAVVAPLTPHPVIAVAPPATAAVADEAGAAAGAASPVPDDPAQHPGVVASPMVGTAYLQPEPGSAAFVKVGDMVAEGQTLLIIEAMKTMNQIPAPRGGTVRRILIDDGAPVEFGTPLMIVD